MIAALPCTTFQKAVRSVADRELARGRFDAGLDSARKSIHDACTKRLGRLSAAKFDNLVAAWLSGNPDKLHSVLRKVKGYGDRRKKVESLLGVQQGPATTTSDLPVAFPTRGTTDIDSRLEVERTAIQCVIERFRERGYSVCSVEDDRVGWDLEARIDGQPILRLEVKGLSLGIPRVELTLNEYEKAVHNSRSHRRPALLYPSTSLSCHFASVRVFLPLVGPLVADERARLDCSPDRSAQLFS